MQWIRFIWAAVVVCTCQANAQPMAYQTVVISGQPAPGVAGVFYRDRFAFAPAIGEDGAVLFTAPTEGPGITNGDASNGLWSWNSGILGRVAVGLDPAPGIVNGTYYTNRSGPNPIIRHRNTLTYSTEFTSDSTGRREGIWSGDFTSQGLVIGEGYTAPGFDNWTTHTIGTPRINTSGQVAFFANPRGPSASDSSDAIYRSSGGSLELLLVDDQTFLGNHQMVGIDSRISMNETGAISFRSKLTDSQTQQLSGEAVWKYDNGISTIATSDDTAPGLPVTQNFRRFEYDRMNGDGNVSFLALTRDYVGIWLSKNNSIELAVSSNTPHPNRPGVRIIPHREEHHLTDSGSLFFRTISDGPGIDLSNNTALWMWQSGDLTLLAEESSPAPTADGMVFGDIIGQPAYNSTGQFVFDASLAQPGGFDESFALFAGDEATGSMFELIRTGDEFEVAPGDTRLIRSFTFARGGANTGEIASLNDLGQFVVLIEFTDLTDGIFIFQIPTPGTFSLLVLAVSASSRQRRFQAAS